MVKRSEVRKGLLMSAGLKSDEKNKLKIIDFRMNEASKIINCDSLSFLRVQPFAINEKLFNDLVIVIDDEFLFNDNQEYNWFASALYNSISPILGHAILSRDGGTISEDDLNLIINNHKQWKDC